MNAAADEEDEQKNAREREMRDDGVDRASNETLSTVCGDQTGVRQMKSQAIIPATDLITYLVQMAT